MKVLEEVKEVEKTVKQDKRKDVIIHRAIGPLEVLKKQYYMILDILGIRNNDPKEIEMIKMKYESLGPFAIQFNKKEDICFNMLSHCLNLSSTIILRDIKVHIIKSLHKMKKSLLDELNILVRLFLNKIFSFFS